MADDKWMEPGGEIRYPSAASLPPAPPTLDAVRLFEMREWLETHNGGFLREELIALLATVAALRAEVARKDTAINQACEIIERGDQRLLASDGPAGGQPPDLSLAEWRTLYVILDAARSSAAGEDTDG